MDSGSLVIRAISICSYLITSHASTPTGWNDESCIMVGLPTCFRMSHYRQVRNHNPTPRIFPVGLSHTLLLDQKSALDVSETASVKYLGYANQQVYLLRQFKAP